VFSLFWYSTTLPSILSDHLGYPVQLQVTAPKFEDRFNSARGFYVSEWIREHASDAQAYGAIFVGNNLRIGEDIVDALPVAVLPRTMITWSSLYPGAERVYADRKCSHFAERVNLDAIVGFLENIITQTAA